MVTKESVFTIKHLVVNAIRFGVAGLDYALDCAPWLFASGMGLSPRRLAAGDAIDSLEFNFDRTSRLIDEIHRHESV